MYLIFDTETTGLPQSYKAPLTDFDNWPRMVQIAWQMHDEKGTLIDVKNFIIQPCRSIKKKNWRSTTWRQNQNECNKI